ncbi:MAG TPA: R3H domain-containing nucleic acid-binding protein [Coleofasciculaceae cyanobacterium]|jgi:spoIIIJ-associated protein
MSNQLIQRGQQWLEELLRLSRLPAEVRATNEEQTSEDRPNYWLTINETQLTPQQIQILIGSDGSVLDAIQYLANSILNLGQEEEHQSAYTVELDGYRLRRQEELQAMAAYAAQKVRETGEEFEMKSLSSAERRQVHTFLKECDDLETHSRGQEPDRRLIVRRR